MGMYNEVYKFCKNCETRMEVQIPQIELGFGQYNLDNPSSYSHLNEEQKAELFSSLEGKTFYCDICESSDSALYVTCPDCNACLSIEDGNTLKWIERKQ